MTSSARQWDARLYDEHHGYVARLGRDLLDLLRPQVGESILDLGCGTGDLTEQLVASGSQVLGVDSSAEMVAAARAKYPQHSFLQADACALDEALAGQRFDAIFSNAVLHWIRQPELALRQMADRLKEGGRLVLEMGGARNIGAICSGLQEVRSRMALPEVESPWYFPSLSQYCALVEASGLRVGAAWHFARPTPIEGQGGLRYWLTMFANAYLDDVDAAMRERLIEEVEDGARAALFRDGRWWIDYWRLRVVAYRG